MISTASTESALVFSARVCGGLAPYERNFISLNFTETGRLPARALPHEGL